MIAVDTRAVLIPMLPGRVHPTGQQLLVLCGADSLGALRTVCIERTGKLPVGRELVADSYAEAADLLMLLVGDIVELTALGDPASARLVVHHRTATGAAAEIRLVAVPTDSDRWTVALEAERGRAELTASRGLLGPVQLRCSLEGTNPEIGTTPGPEHSLILQLVRARAGLPHTPKWDDAVRAAELAEAAFESLERRRAVDLYHPRRNELASFKGTMTSCGCGLVWLSLALFILVAAGKGLGLPRMDWLAVAIVVLWVVFLGLQAFRWVFPREHY